MIEYGRKLLTLLQGQNVPPLLYIGKSYFSFTLLSTTSIYLIFQSHQASRDDISASQEVNAVGSMCHLVQSPIGAVLHGVRAASRPATRSAVESQVVLVLALYTSYF